jgi:hypothetical protein
MEAYDIFFKWRDRERKAYVHDWSDSWEVYCSDTDVLNEVSGRISFDAAKEATPGRKPKAADVDSLYRAMRTQLR